MKSSLSFLRAYVVIKCYTNHCIPLLSFVSRVGIGFSLLVLVILTNQLGAEEDADGERHDQQDGQDGDHRDEAQVTQAVTYRNILSAGRGTCEHMDMERSNFFIFIFHTHTHYIQLVMCPRAALSVKGKKNIVQVHKHRTGVILNPSSNSSFDVYPVFRNRTEYFKSFNMK